MKYWPSVWRGLFYFSVEVAAFWSKELAAMIKDHSFPVLHNAEWWALGLASFVAGAMAVRAYFDGTHGRMVEKMENGKVETKQ